MNDSKNLPAVIQQAISEQRVDLSKVNLMLPTQTFGQIIGQYDKVVIEVVTVDKDPKAGEVAEITDGKFALQRVPLEKIGSAVGIIWDPAQTTIIESSPTKSRAKATGALRKPNGEWIVLSEEKTVDLAAFEEEQRLSIEDRAEKGNFKGDVTEWGKTKTGRSFPKAFTPWQSEEQKLKTIDRAVREAMVQYRKFKDERAMTGAKERCIRALLAIKSAYTEEELSHPFAFPRVIPDTNKMLANPKIRGEAIRRMTGTANAIFGPGNSHTTRNVSPAALPEPEATVVEVGGGTPEDAPAAEADPFGVDAEVEGQAEPTPEEVARLALGDWLASDILTAGAKDLIRGALAKEDTPLKELQSLIGRATTFAKAKQEKAAGRKGGGS